MRCSNESISTICQPSISCLQSFKKVSDWKMRSGVLPAAWLLLNLHTRMIFRASAFILFLFFTTLSPNTVCEVLCILSLNVLKYITFLSLIYVSSLSFSLHSFVLSIIFLSLNLYILSLSLSQNYSFNQTSFCLSTFSLSLNPSVSKCCLS